VRLALGGVLLNEILRQILNFGRAIDISASTSIHNAPAERDSDKAQPCAIFKRDAESGKEPVAPGILVDGLWRRSRRQSNVIVEKFQRSRSKAVYNPYVSSVR
jgi:hypothetical protein